jgi:hypothetical protein
MSLREFLGLKRENRKAYGLYLQHISSGNKFYTLTIQLAFFVSLLPFALRTPLIGNLLRAVQNLFVGYIVENDSPLQESASSETLYFVENFAYEKTRVYDYVIVGSGPGAAVAAAKISSEKSVLIIEQGDFPLTSTSKHHTLEHVRNDFSKKGQEFILSSWMAQFAQAATFGGGSEVNSGLYHQLPAHLLETFSNESRLDMRTYLASELRIKEFLRVEEMSVDKNHSIIARGANRSGMEYGNIPRWRHYASDGSFVHHGMNFLFWSERISSGAIEFLRNTKVYGIDNSDQKVIRVKVKSDKKSAQTIRCNNLIMSAGTIQTPYVLCRSGILPWRDTRFQWHPMVRTMVETDAQDLGLLDVDPFQCWTADRRFKIGSAVSTPGLMAMNLGRIMKPDELSALRSIYISFVSSGRGGLVPNTDIPWYVPSQLDKENLKQSREILETFVTAAGAKFVNHTEKVKLGVSTVHIFGSMPLNSSIYETGTARLSKDHRIQISDASLLPFGPGVNPQGIVMSLCDAMIRGD